MLRKGTEKLTQLKLGFVNNMNSITRFEFGTSTRDMWWNAFDISACVSSIGTRLDFDWIWLC